MLPPEPGASGILAEKPRPLPSAPPPLPRIAPPEPGEPTAGRRLGRASAPRRGPPRPRPGAVRAGSRACVLGETPGGSRRGPPRPGPRFRSRRTCRRRERRRRRPWRGDRPRRQWDRAERRGPPLRAAAAPAGDPDLAWLPSGGGGCSQVLFGINVGFFAFLCLGGGGGVRRRRSVAATCLVFVSFPGMSRVNHLLSLRLQLDHTTSGQSTPNAGFSLKQEFSGNG